MGGETRWTKPPTFDRQMNLTKFFTYTKVFFTLCTLNTRHILFLTHTCDLNSTLRLHCIQWYRATLYYVDLFLWLYDYDLYNDFIVVLHSSEE